jgi:hypothetical protein
MINLHNQTLKGLQHLTNTARLKAYRKEEFAEIGEILDQVDYVFNLLKEEPVDWRRIQNIFELITHNHKDCNPNDLTLDIS